MSAHHQARGVGRHAHLSSSVAGSGSQQFQPPAPTPILKPSEIKRQFMMHADFQSYAKTVKKFLNGTLTKTEFHAELGKVLPTKEKLALHNWLVLSILRSAYSDYNAQKKGAHVGGSGTSYKSQNLRALSDHSIFKKKMQRTAQQNSLNGVSEDAVSMVIAALQQHLLRTLSAIRASRSAANEVEDPTEDQQVLETSVPGDISIDDVANTLWRRPTVLCENASLVQHRLAVD